MVHVAWDDAAAYARWANRRLPTEAEWEFAARGGNRRTHHAWGDDPHDPDHPQARIYQGEFPTNAASPKPVGSYPPTGFGLYDMAGNVWQWTTDWYRPDTYAIDHARGVASNPTGPPRGLDPQSEGIPARVVRGGSFLSTAVECRVSARGREAPGFSAEWIGFRCVKDAQ